MKASIGTTRASASFAGHPLGGTRADANSLYLTNEVINVSGNLYKTLRNISAIGNDVSWSKIGGCGKGQMNLRSCYGAPHVIVNGIVVGGR